MAIEMAKDIQAEQQAIGAMIFDQEAVMIALDILDHDDFTDRRHGFIFNAIKALNEDFVLVEPQSVISKLKTMDVLQDAGGAAYVIEICQTVATSANIKLFADTVKKRSLARKLMGITYAYYQKSAKEFADGKELFEGISKELSDLVIELPKTNLRHISEICDEAITEIESCILNKRGQGIQTGYMDIDRILCGLKPGTMTILAARPSVGKTSMALNIANNAAKDGAGVAYFSLEMASSQLITRLICNEADINLDDLRHGGISKSAMSSITKAGNELAERIMWFDDSASTKITSIYSRCARLKAEQKLGLVVIDYIGLIDTPYVRGRSREQEVAYLSKNIKAMARELDIPVIALSQLSRSSEHGDGRPPRLSDLRDSGSLEQDADIVVFLHTDDKTKPEIKVCIAKNRNGGIGDCEMYFDRAHQRFNSIAKRDDYPNRDFSSPF